MSEPRVAVYCSTRNGYNDMSTAAKSLLVHDGADYVYFLTEDDEFPETLPRCVTCCNVSDQPWFDPSGPNYNTPWTYMVLMRVALSQFFAKYDKVLSLDTDTIVTSRIDPLWLINMEGYYFGMVQERLRKEENYPVFPYYNFGVSLQNLKLLRESGMDLRLIDAVNTTDYKYNEQDAVNILCADKILPLLPEYNAIQHNVPEIPFGLEYIRHFTFSKPPSRHALYRKYLYMSWDDVLRQREAFRGSSWSRRS